VLTRLQGVLGASAVTLLVIGLVLLEASNRGFRSWWAAHTLTTDVVAGVLVLLLTLLVVDQLVRRRQLNDRARAVAAQGAIVMLQAERTAAAVIALLDGSDDRSGAAEELRTYMMSVLVAAPLLIDVPVTRQFLEQAQRLGGEMARALAALAKDADPKSFSRVRLNSAVDQLKAASAPLLQVFDVEAFMALDAEESQPPP
jgi:hypothetical protein